MVGLTHAIGGATTVIGAHYFFPETFPLSIWIILLSFFIGQGPDIDIKQSRIAKNIYIKPFIFFIQPFIDGHRAKQTHSLFGNAFFMLYAIPFIYIFGLPGWFSLGLAYFSHLFLDFFNPTGVKLFYIPFLNPNPRAWSLYNAIPQLVNEVPYFFKKLIFLFNKKKRKNIKRKQIKFDGVGVMTGQKAEKVIASALWILFFGLIALNFKALKDVLFIEGIWLTFVFPLSFLILLNITIKNYRFIMKNSRIFQFFFVLGVIPFVGAYLGNIEGYLTYLKQAHWISSIIFIWTISLLPLVYFLGKKLKEEILSHPSMLFGGKEPQKEYFDYSIFSQVTLLLLLISSITSIQSYDNGINKWTDFYNNIESTESVAKQAIEVIKNSYIENIATIKEEIK